MTNAILRGKPDAGNPHVRFDEGEVASAKPRRGSLLYDAPVTRRMMFRSVCVLLSGLVCLPILAFDAQTIAIYDFKSSHTNAVGEGTLITNLIDNLRFTGVNHLDGLDTDLTRYSADRPGKYVFERAVYGATPVITDPQSLRFAYKTGVTTGRCVSFADIGSELSTNNDWTVEYFFKCEEGAQVEWNIAAKMNCGFLYNPAAGGAEAGTQQPLTMLFGKTFYTYIKGANDHAVNIQPQDFKREGDPLRSTYADGLWHHYAVVYRASDKKFSVYIDHSELQKECNRSTDHAAVTTSEPLNLGMKMDGFVSCLRVSKCARTPGTFLHASEDANFVRDERVFHWRLDGENGSAVSTVTNLYATTNPFVGQYVGTLDCSAPATAVTGTGTPAPVYSNAMPNATRRFLRSGGERFDDANGGSVFCGIKQRTTEPYFLTSSGLALKGDNHIPVDAGSFTIEFFAQLDRDGWLAKTAGTEYPRLTIFSLLNDQDGTYYADLSFQIQIAENPQHGTVWNLLLQVGAKIPTPTKTSGAYYANPLYENNPWHHYAIVYDEEALTIRAYVDGASIYKIDLSAPFAPATKHAKRDYQFGYGANNHPAQITYDEVRMVRRALAPSEFMTWHRSNGGIAVIVR